MSGQRVFVMGHPIGHSRSPMMHGYWLKQLGIDATYTPLDIAPDDIAGFFAGFRDAGWTGGNVTVPHKEAVIPHIDAIDDDARAIGAVNTLWWQDDRLIGGNTDAYGFMANLDDRAPGWDRGAERAVVIGAGGATRAIVHGLTGRGMSVAVANRTEERARSLAAKFAGVTGHGMADLPGLLAEADLLVNATSLGMSGQPPLDVDLAPLKSGAVVTDIVYAPLETGLLKSAAGRGHETVDGLGMLIHQGAEAFRRWFGILPDATDELRALLIEDLTRSSH